jgi:hypothetical protein
VFQSKSCSREKSEHELTTCSKLALRKGGYYEKMIIVDSEGTALNINGAKKLHGVGFLWGYNIFLNQRIRVQLQVKDSFQMQLDEVKQRILESFRKWHGWKTRGDFSELKKPVQNAESIPDIIRCLTGETVA